MQPGARHPHLEWPWRSAEVSAVGGPSECMHSARRALGSIHVGDDVMIRGQRVVVAGDVPVRTVLAAPLPVVCRPSRLV